MGFREIGLSARAASTAIQHSVALAEQARHDYAQSEIDGGRKPRRIWIAGSLGAYGAALHNGAEFHGNYNIGHAELVAFHAERINAMRDTNADFLAFETIPSLAEAEAILEALSQHPDLAAYISFTCRDDAHTGHGEPIEQCARLLDAAPGIIAIGINCTAPRYVLPLIQAIRAVTAKRIAVYPNSGETWVPETRSWTGTSDPNLFGDMARSLAQRRSRLDRRLLPHRPATHPGDCKPTRLIFSTNAQCVEADNSIAGDRVSLNNGREIFQKERVTHGLQENRQRDSRMAVR